MDAHSAASDLRTLYRQILGRAIDNWSLMEHDSRLVEGHETVRDIVRGFADSPEYVEKFVAPYPSPLDQITLAYKHFLGRDPDEESLAAYTRQITAGRRIEEIITDLIESQEYTDKFGDHSVPHP